MPEPCISTCCHLWVSLRPRKRVATGSEGVWGFGWFDSEIFQLHDVFRSDIKSSIFLEHHAFAQKVIAFLIMEKEGQLKSTLFENAPVCAKLHPSCVELRPLCGLIPWPESRCFTHVMHESPRKKALVPKKMLAFPLTVASFCREVSVWGCGFKKNMPHLDLCCQLGCCKHGR